ncbi:ankyrin repeat domain-containing protein, partial [Candidatus Dependentiae bacterium]|nr:ankyrin repeat domain-containing protein [Candidatus Dependentiae bacterium]
DTFLREQSTGYVAFNTRMIVLGENTHLEEAVKPLKSSLDDHALSIFGAMNPVCEAAKINNHEAILALKRAGADMNEVDDMGRSPIHYAAYHGHCDTIATLKDLGANIDVYTRDQKTALHVAAYRNQYDATNLLLSLNANPNLSDEHGSTPLHFVSGRKESDINIGFKLVEYGANPNSPDSDGVTPLVLATQTGKSELVQCFQKCAQQPAVSEKIPSPSPEKSYAEKMSQVKGSNSKEI